MDVTVITAFLAPCLPFLLQKVGEPALSAAATKLGQETWDQAKAIWGKLHPTIVAEAGANVAATKLAEKPDSAVWQAAFTEELEAILTKNPALGELIAAILQDKSADNPVSVQIQQTAGTVEGQMIGQMQNSKNIHMGDVHGNISL